MLASSELQSKTGTGDFHDFSLDSDAGRRSAEASRSENKSTLRNRKAFLESGTLLFNPTKTNNNKKRVRLLGLCPNETRSPDKCTTSDICSVTNPKRVECLLEKAEDESHHCEKFHNQTTGELQCNYNPAQRGHTTHNKQYRWHSSQYHDRVQVAFISFPV